MKKTKTQEIEELKAQLAKSIERENDYKGKAFDLFTELENVKKELVSEKTQRHLAELELERLSGRADALELALRLMHKAEKPEPKAVTVPKAVGGPLDPGPGNAYYNMLGMRYDPLKGF